jgi:outer membrane protein assembly factor BamB
MTKRFLKLLLIALAVPCIANPSAASADSNDQLAWRENDGVVAQGNYPTKWDNGSNIAWRIKLPGRGASSPIVVDGKVFVTVVNESKNELLCFDATGKQLWAYTGGEASQSKHQKATGANSSPVSNGKLIYAYFKSGDLIACDLNGKKAWEINLPSVYGAITSESLWWDMGNSPILTDNAVVIATMQSGPSYVVAFDQATGKEIWKTDRQFNVNAESNQAYTTPALAKQSNRTLILTVGADHLAAHDDKGKSLFNVGGFNPNDDRFFRLIASPVSSDEIVICPHSRGQTTTAISLAADVDDAKRVLWSRDDVGSDVPTPVIHGDELFVLGDKGKVSCLELSTGEIKWDLELPKNRAAYSSSPVLADGKLYCVREDATTFVVDVAKHEVIAENRLEGNTVATPAFANDHIYFRTYDELICIQ